jgi:diguanylate cyclase (GGDEF)-like protein
MVDREQEQARLMADAMGANGRAGRDLAWIVSFGIVLVVLAMATGAVDRFLDWANGLAGTNVNGLLALLVLVPIGATVYAIRRYHDASAAREKLHELSYHDSLTGLPNRRFLGEGFDEMLKSVRRYNGRVGVFFIDLDGFKKINDTYGHEVGDQLMVAVSDRIRGTLGQTDQVVRYGGDEFVLLCPEVTNSVSAERIAQRVLKVIEAPFEMGDDRLRISGSIGIALTEERCMRPDEVLRDADAAMYQAKNQGPGRYAIFDRSMSDQITPSTAERRLRQALEQGEFRLYYQPIVSLWTKRLVGVEALLRWNDPRRGMVAPGEFMNALEDTGLIVPIGNWIIEEVCAQSKRWQDAYPDRPALNIKVNVSARQLAQANFVSLLREALDRSGADPDRITLEITEGALMYDVSSAWSTLREAKSLGISLALDDFGTGYSSLSYLRQFSLDLLKIDQSFVDGLGVSREDTTIIEHVIGMAKALGIVTVAEGVETEEQVQHLRAMNCDLAQGYYFSHPQPPDVIGHLMGEHGNSQEWKPPARTDEPVDSAPVVAPERFRPASSTPSVTPTS